MANRTTFLVDGFNLYHSVVDARKDLNGASTKWLDIRALCRSFLPLFGKDHTLEEIYYFSALANHKNLIDPNTVQRHLTFIDCLKSTGIIVQLANFKPKEVICNDCGAVRTRHEEKETDVAIASKLIELFVRKKCDTAILMSGDTDIAPAVRTVNALFPDKTVGFLFPYKRKNKELRQLGFGCKISKERYTQFQFPDSVTLPDGAIRTKPSTW